MSSKERFRNLRQQVMQAIAKALEEDDYHKSYEGCFEWIVEYPNFFEDETGTAYPTWYCLRLYCYVLGPASHYEWCGDTMAEVLDKAEHEIYSWLKK